MAGFSGSSQSNYISALVSYRKVTGWMPPQPIIVQPDITNKVGYRWGDYCATTLDPADDWSFWPVLEYAARTTNSLGIIEGRWGTAVCRIRPVP